MKKFVFLLLPFSILTYLITINPFHSETFSTEDTLYIKPDKNHSQVEMLVTTILDKYHYRKMDLNDSLSSAIFDNYLESLDGNKLYFTQADIAEFEKHRDKFDDYLKSGELKPAYDMFYAFRKSFYDRINFLDSLLLNEFDFSEDEFYQTDRSQLEYAADEKELNEIWRQWVKSEALNLKLGGKDWPGIVEALQKRYQNMRKSIGQIKSEDIFQVYMNAFTESYDPHTNYFSPIAYDNFKINMSQALEGIGARLQIENDYTKIQEVIPGGPAFKSKLVNKNDRIVGVAQGEKGEMVDVFGWRLDDVVQLIRGPKGSVVRLQILPASMGANALPMEVTLIRDRIKIEETLPSKKIYTLNKDNRKYKLGVITIPSFYLEFDKAGKEGEDFNSTTKDVRKLLAEMRQENIDGLVIDLRLNGGGSLNEAIELTGLFIPEGPVVQVRNSNGTVDVAEDPDPEMVYDGPLAVLVNRFSASASEIFAGAIQDYGRGIIVGEQTFGKGTVQNLLDLDKFIPRKDSDFGNVKITLAKFYRITGSSTQHRGVTPDIEFPSAFSAKEYGESSMESALPWDQIESTKYQRIDFVEPSMLEKLQARYNKRLETDQDLKELLQEIQELEEDRNRTMISLNETIRLQERKEAEKNREAHLKLSGTIASELGEEQTSADVEDTYLKESMEILSEMIDYITG